MAAAVRGSGVIGGGAGGGGVVGGGSDTQVAWRCYGVAVSRRCGGVAEGSRFFAAAISRNDGFDYIRKAKYFSILRRGHLRSFRSRAA